MPAPLQLAFIWHMHQPYYRNDLTGDWAMPWVRLHAVKDYYDIIAYLDRFPKLKMTVNVVPCMMEQLEAYVSTGTLDPVESLARLPVADWTEAQRISALELFFLLNIDNMAKPLPRFAELWFKRGPSADRQKLQKRAAEFSKQDFQDLAMLYHLAWSGNHLRQRPELKSLLAKGRSYTYDEIGSLLDLQREFCGEIIPLYKRLQDAGRLEVSVSPYYHPILPLLVDPAVARVALPDRPMPAAPVAWARDARVQLQRAVEFYRARFGRDPLGLWPSEGSVSEGILPLVAEAGLRWLASDADVLQHSMNWDGRSTANPAPLKDRALLEPYSIAVGKTKLSLLFRDHLLSDKLGFVYSKWDPKSAAVDFISTLEGIAKSLPDDGRAHLLTIILDGENAWEYYPKNGHSFFMELYNRLSASSPVECTTPSDYLAASPARKSLTRLWPGSWIGHSFAIWIGKPEKNRGWEALWAARELYQAKLEEAQAKGEEDLLHLNQAYRELLIAEGSDWFWWYDDDHISAQSDLFDELFRTHLANVYRLLELPVPDELNIPFHKSKGGLIPKYLPLRKLHPTLEGRISHFFEWQFAGMYEGIMGGGAMHRGDSWLRTLLFGFSDDRLYLRGDLDIARLIRENVAVVFEFTRPQEAEWRVVPQADGMWRGEGPREWSELGAREILEVGIPLEDLQLTPGEEVALVVRLMRGGKELEAFPAQGELRFTMPTEDYYLAQWSV